MSKTNAKRKQIKTHEGAVAPHINAEQQLRRSVMACMLWENEFYESGQTIGARIAEACKKVKPEIVSKIAIEARTQFKLRHVPLLLARELARTGGRVVGDTIFNVIQRADELTEFLALYWKDGKVPLSAQVKQGLARAFRKFDAYQLAKYNRDDAIKLRDVLFLSHAKPKDAEQDALWKQLIAGTLPAPDTWEVSLSGGANKRETFERLMAENKLGAMAFLRNLRNMAQAGIEKSTVAEYAKRAKIDRVLPFRFIAAALACPQWEDAIEPMMMSAAGNFEKLEGQTVVLIDHSGSMEQKLSDKSEMSKFDAAAALAILLREIADTRVFTFSDRCIEVAPRRGFALRDAIKAVINPVSTHLGAAVRHVYKEVPNCRRLIVITDEQSADKPGDPIGTGYVINVASNRNGLGYGAWVHIDGFSEAVIGWIREFEKKESVNA